LATQAFLNIPKESSFIAENLRNAELHTERDLSIIRTFTPEIFIEGFKEYYRPRIPFIERGIEVTLMRECRLLSD
jgi:hypothetical protein